MVEPLSIGLGTGTAISLLLANSIYVRYNSYKDEYIETRQGKGGFEKVIKNPKKKYGLICLYKPSFSYFKRSVKNTGELVYDALISRGYEKENLFVLEGKNKPSNQFDCNTLPFSKKHTIEALEHLGKEIKENDVFFMYVMTHGYKTRPIPFIYGGQSTLMTFDNEFWITEKELEERLSDIHSHYSVTFFNSCYGGGFAKRLGKGRNIGISVSREDKSTMGYSGVKISEKYGDFISAFTMFFFSVLKGSLPDGKKIDFPNDLSTAFRASSIYERISHDDDMKRVYWKKMFSFFKNTPHLFYDKINPGQVVL